MGNMRFQPVANFTGGLNLRPDQLQLVEGEFPYCRNVDIDRRGGVVTRPSWKFVGTAGSRAVAQSWSMFDFTTATYRQLITSANPPVAYTVDSPAGGRIYYHTVAGSSSVTVTTQTSMGIDSGRVSGGVSCAQVGTTLYLARGKIYQGYTWSGAAATALTASAPTWQDSFASPTGTHMPQAEHVASHLGYLWVAATSENGTTYLNRVRFSHPNFPQSWRSMDWIDVVDGGPTIRALVPFGDMMLVFKDDAVFAILGYDVDTFQLVKLANIGCMSDRHVAVSDTSLYFFSHSGKGIYRLDRQGGLDQISEEISPIFDPTITNSATRSNHASLSFCGGKLRFSVNIQNSTLESYVSNPFGLITNGSNLYPSCVFTYDPVSEGWSLHTGANATGLGFLSARDLRSAQGVVSPIAAFSSSSTGVNFLSYFVSLDGSTYTGDDYLSNGQNYDATGVAGGVVADATATLAFTPMIRTPWIDGGNAAVRKRWLRPELTTRELSGSTVMTVRSFRDYDETTAVRSVSSTSTGANNTGAVIVRSGPLGTAKTMQLLVELPTAVKAGLLSATLKYVPRQARA